MKRLVISLFCGGLFLMAPHCMAAASDDHETSSVFRFSDLSALSIEQLWQQAEKNKSKDGKGLKIGGQSYNTGWGTMARSTLAINMEGSKGELSLLVGMDDDTLPNKGHVNFKVLGDDKVLWESSVMETGDKAKECKVGIDGVRVLLIVSEPVENGYYYNHADWINGEIAYSGKTPEVFALPKEEKYILTPPAPDTPRITGAKVYGVRPNHPFLYKIPCTGKKPLEYSVEGLPEGLKLDSETGIITGKIAQKGDYPVKFSAKNSLGSFERDFTIKCGDKIALTPPMGWNSWNCFAGSVSEKKIRTAAKAMAESGLMDYGYGYINIDDYWTMNPKLPYDKDLNGPERHDDGNINVNKRFKDMKALFDYIHSFGLKGGIYSSPGPYTCGLCVASFDHEFLDAKKFGEWGVDYLKYDTCTYTPDMESSRTRKIDWDKTNLDKVLEKFPKLRTDVAPFALMDYALRTSADRDIVFSLCQYGGADVWKWGDLVGGSCWRTTGDISDRWCCLRYIWSRQRELYPYAGPGHWNDPDMLVIGPLGWGTVRPSRLTPSEQYTHFTLWSMLCSPLLLGCDLSQLDDFTLNIFCNHEVLEVNQDPLGNQAKMIMTTSYKSDGAALELWSKSMEDGSTVVGFFDVREAYEPSAKEVRIPWQKLIGADKPSRVRDLWRQKDVDIAEGSDCVVAPLPAHGVQLLRIWK
ncbi:alpha-galactosidase [Candidatus Sumerlaeota bacterium]|nr:alpha-galactosidase [Candidatus Sumerlaeota bacterium]